MFAPQYSVFSATCPSILAVVDLPLDFNGRDLPRGLINIAAGLDNSCRRSIGYSLGSCVALAPVYDNGWSVYQNGFGSAYMEYYGPVFDTP